MKLGMSLPVWRGLAVLAAVLLAVPAGGAAGAGMPAAHCRDVRATRAALCRFVAAVNNGNLRRLLAPARQFRHYSVQGPTGVDTGDRAALLAYASGRRGHSEKLRLTWFSLNRSPRDVPSFRFDVVRGADDLALPTLYPGSAKLRCAARCRLVALTMAPNVEPPRPAPATYAETCKLVGPTWCEDTPTPGGIPSDLRRPLRLPTVRPGQPCPVTEPRRFDGDRFGGLALEDGPRRTAHRARMGTPRRHPLLHPRFIRLVRRQDPLVLDAPISRPRADPRAPARRPPQDRHGRGARPGRPPAWPRRDAQRPRRMERMAGRNAGAHTRLH